MPIIVLSPDVASKIAAGEVVERPASVVKELVENSLDAGATQISVEVQGGGLQLISVADNGSGIPTNQVALAFERYATSKLNTVDDLDTVATLGFRGEALPSIAAVSRIHMMTREPIALAGHEIWLRYGTVEKQGRCGCAPGTSVAVQGLFENVPARLKFLKSSSAEAARISDLVSRLALAFPSASFRLTVDGREALATPGRGKLQDTIVAVYGSEVGQHLVELRHPSRDGYEVHGFATLPTYSRSNRSYVTFLVNKRWVQSRLLTQAVDEAYHGFLEQGRHPLVVISIAVPTGDIDVNIHPTKREVRFRREDTVFSVVQRALRGALTERAPVPQIQVVPSVQSAQTQMSNAASLFMKLPTPGQPKTFVSPEGSIVSRDALPQLRVLGQVDRTFIAAEGPGGLYLIDQHAAHERVIYEQVKQRFQLNTNVQPLLEPVAVELPPEQSELVRESMELLAHYGFTLEPLEGRAYLLRTVPWIVKSASPGKALLEVLDLMAGERRLSSREDVLAASIACHAAVRAGKEMGHDEMVGLVRALEQAEESRTCPHGRPTMLHISSRHLEREFGRR